MLIPPRRLTQWATIAGTETSFASVVPVVVNRHIYETAAANVVMAYPRSEASDPAQHGVRLDFRWVVQLLFTGFWGADPTENSGIGAARTTFALNVLDDSPLAAQFLAGFSGTEWPFDYRPDEVIRHFHISFDDFGRYDVLAVDCTARKFSWSPDEQPPWQPDASPAHHAAQQAKEEASVLSAAMALDSLAPLVNDPFDEAPPDEPRGQ